MSTKDDDQNSDEETKRRLNLCSAPAHFVGGADVRFTTRKRSLNGRACSGSIMLKFC